MAASSATCAKGKNHPIMHRSGRSSLPRFLLLLLLLIPKITLARRLGSRAGAGSFGLTAYLPARRRYLRHRPYFECPVLCTESPIRRRKRSCLRRRLHVLQTLDCPLARDHGRRGRLRTTPGISRALSGNSADGIRTRGQADRDRRPCFQRRGGRDSFVRTWQSDEFLALVFRTHPGLCANHGGRLHINRWPPGAGAYRDFDFVG